MEEKTARLLIAGAILIVLAGGIFGGWFKTAADMTVGKVPMASIETTTTQSQQPTTTSKETTTQPQETTTTLPEQPREPEPVNGVYKLERQKYLEYNGYKFKLDSFIYEAGYKVYGIIIDVVKPDGTEVQLQADNNADGIVDALEIKFDGKYPEDYSWATVRIWEQEPADGSLKLETQKYIEYKGYKFQLDHAILAAGYKVAGLLIDVVKPDGTEAKVQVDIRNDGLVDSLRIYFTGEYQQDADGKYIEEGWATVKVETKGN